jgi:hypothetical protein
MNPAIQQIENEIAPLRQQLINHTLYAKINSIEAVHTFMEAHVFAVWDFMSLLKGLQIGLTNTILPWTPKGNPVSRKLINEIVCGEESDVNELGEPMSHYEMYLEAMMQLGASTKKVNQFIQKIETGTPVFIALQEVDVPAGVANFVNFSFEVLKGGKLHEIAAAFTFGREDLIPDMFVSILKDIDVSNDVQMNKLIYYFERHIEVDGGEHGPMALSMITELCGNDERKWKEVAKISKLALEVRLSLWDGIEELLEVKQNSLVEA